MRIITSLMLSAAFLAPVHADGLIHKLPADGATSTYQMTMEMARGETKREGKGQLTLRSVGKSEVDGQPCRWIEFRMELNVNDRDQVIIAKALIPEKQLAAGKSPIDHVKKLWLKMDDRDPVEVDDATGNQGGPLTVFLAGPGKETKKLEAKTIETKLGKLKCVGLHGERTFTQGSQELEAETTVRLNDKVPFGVASKDIKLKIDSNGSTQNISMKLTIESVGTGAKSELPDHQ